MAAFIDAWDQHLVVHLADEERLLGPVMNASDRLRLCAEHQELRDLAQSMGQMRRQVDPDGPTLAKVGQMLENRIRWEEREWFARLQNRLSSEALEQLEREIHGLEQQRQRPAGHRRQAGKKPAGRPMMSDSRILDESTPLAELFKTLSQTQGFLQS